MYTVFSFIEKLFYETFSLIWLKMFVSFLKDDESIV